MASEVYSTPSALNPATSARALTLIPIFSFTQHGHRIPISPVLERVLSRLAVTFPTWVARETIIEDCELSDVADPRARLRQICWVLRSRLNFELIVGDRKRLGINPECQVDLYGARQWSRWLMTHQFSKDAVSAVPHWLVSLASQPLLSDWEWDDSWLHPAQTQWDVLRRETQAGLSRGLLDLGKFDEAVVCAHGLIQQDPMWEDAWEVLIEALLRSGRRAEARIQFESLTKLLRTELGVTPRPTTHRLVEALLTTKL